MRFVTSCSLWTGGSLHVIMILASNSLIKPAQQGGCLFLFTSENILCTFNKHKQTLVTAKYGIIKQLTHSECWTWWYPTIFHSKSI